MKVYLIGVGMGNPGTMTAEALEAVRACPVLVGAPRLLERWARRHRLLQRGQAAVGPAGGP